MSGRKQRQLEADSTRIRLLEAGLELLRDDPESSIAEVLTARKVFAKAKLSSGAFYAHFDGQDHFVEQLIDYALAMSPIPDLANAMQAWLETVEAGGTPADAFIAGGAAALRTGDTDITVPFIHMRRARARSGNKAMAELQTFYELRHGQLAESCSAILEMTRRQLRPPFTLRDLTTAITVLYEGCELRRAVLPADVPDETFGTLMLAVFELYSRPLTDSRSRDEWLAATSAGWSPPAS